MVAGAGPLQPARGVLGPPLADPRADAWRGFTTGDWCDGIDVRDFIQTNYTPYEGDDSFLAGPTGRTTGIWAILCELFPEERRKGVYDVDFETPAAITAHGPGYIDKDNEIIVGLQTDAPLKRAIMPLGGWRMVVKELETYGYPTKPELEEIFTKYRKTHNDGVFDVYPPNVRAARGSHIVTGLPDAYGRGRIIGDYRRVALYGVDALIEGKKLERMELDMERSTEDVIRDREENAEQIKALGELKQMAAAYGFDVARPATTAREAVQWLYRPLVTRTSFRYLQTLYNLGPGPEPNLTVLWSDRLPLGFKEFCARVSIDTSSIQYESDELLRPCWGDDTFARRLSQRGNPMWIRFVLVPGLTDAADNVDAVADIVAALDSVERLEVLPFHQLGRDKWAATGEPYLLGATHPPDAALVERVKCQFAARGVTVR